MFVSFSNRNWEICGSTGVIGTPVRIGKAAEVYADDERSTEV